MKTNWILGKKGEKYNKRTRKQKNKKPNVIADDTERQSKNKVIIVRNTSL